MNKYLEGGEFTVDETRPVCVSARTCEIVPAVCGSSFKNKGVPLVLMPLSILPAPTEIPAIGA